MVGLTSLVAYSIKQAAEGRLYNVTIVTGDSVLVRVAENGTILSTAVDPVDPTRLGQNFLIFKMHNSIYVVPSG